MLIVILLCWEYVYQLGSLPEQTLYAISIE